MFTIFCLIAIISSLLVIDEADIVSKILGFFIAFIAISFLIIVGGMCYEIQFGGSL